MKKNKRKLKIILLIITFIIMILIIYVIINPYCLSDKFVVKYISIRIPVGTNIEKVKSKISDKKHWEIEKTELKHGLMFTKTGYPLKSDYGFSNEYVGKKFIYVQLAEYNLPFNTIVFAFFVFDENDKLIRIVIDREVDAP
ncbi:hypothetical protein FACS1894132_13680 [Clostridia bacterium]|nr:hypothetical protein FACS1894132_13680 [Clostridia bacterium]